MPQSQPVRTRTRRSSRDSQTIGGIAIILIGIFALAGNLIPSQEFGYYFLVALGLIILGWGLAARHPRRLVPGGFILGTGVGILLAEHLYPQHGGGIGNGTPEGGVILICMGLGFLLAFALGRLIAPVWIWWSGVVGLLLALIGIALLTGGIALQVVHLLGTVWPLGLIVLGILLLLGMRPHHHG